MNNTVFSDVYSVELYWEWTSSGYKILFFGRGFGLPTLNAVVNDFGRLVVVP